MVREHKDGSRGAQSLNSNDAREILDIVFEALESESRSMCMCSEWEWLRQELAKAGYTPKMLERRMNDRKGSST